MITLRRALVLAIVAALCGVPQSVSAASSDEASTNDIMVPALLVVGLSSIATVAAVSALLVAGRRKSPHGREGRSTPDDDSRRRRLRAPAGGDPIVAALGVDDEMEARRASRNADRARRDSS